MGSHNSITCHLTHVNFNTVHTPP